MPDKNPATERWGGPGASHEDRSKPKPEGRPEAGADSGSRASAVSGGGGEEDRHHSHDAERKGN